MTKMKFYVMAALALTLSLTLGSTVFADSLPDITSKKNIYLYHESNGFMANQLEYNATSNLLSIDSLHDIAIHEPTMVSNLNLPSTVSVTTTGGTMTVPVQWSDYSGVSINTTNQLSGKAVLPPSILNPTNIKLDVTQTVDYNGSGLQSNLGTVMGNNIINIPPATTVQQFISNLSYNGTTLTDSMSAIVVDCHNETLYNGIIIDDTDSLKISDGRYTHTYHLSFIFGTPLNSSLLLSIISPPPIAVPITGMVSNSILPSIIRIDTTSGVVNLPVQWNIPEDLSISENVKIPGTIVIPDNIDNFRGLQLTVYQKINYQPIGISSSLANMVDNFIMNIPAGTSVSSLIDGLTNAGSYTLTFKDEKNKTLETDATIVTGDSLIVTSGNTNYYFYLSIETSITS